MLSHQDEHYVFPKLMRVRFSPDNAVCAKLKDSERWSQVTDIIDQQPSIAHKLI